ncbi:hypothetical protein MVES_003403 [Malassezia vespertilionis]|uniref:Ribonuclease H2 subunit B n=1 Tax=Malassezia vespertilionis TaxID=2020962 RepID=A0A2N1J7S7_9BASI|nr:hypothetical protein MVES_003403 [Malassezia vespertilionis]
MLLAYPDCVAKDTIDLLVLPHPRSHIPTYFAVPQAPCPHEMYELVVVRPEKSAARSWFISSSAQEQGHVLGDGALRLLSPVDPVFVLLGLLAPDSARCESRQFRAWDDLVDGACDWHAQHRAQWHDIPVFLGMQRVLAHADRICDTQAMPTGDGHVYRLNVAKIHALLDVKAQKLLADDVWAKAPETLGRYARKCLDSTPGKTADEQYEAARRNTVKSLLHAHIPACIAAGWT